MTTTGIETSRMDTPPVVSSDEWQSARDALLEKEKAETKVREELAAARRRLPWVEIDKDYRFVGRDGELSLADLFDGRSQLIVYRAFFEPGVENWPEGGCSGCAMFIDNVGHLASERARYDLRARLGGARRRHRALQVADGVGHAVVQHRRRLLGGLRCRRVLRAQRLHPSRRPHLPHILHQRSRRRGDRQRVEPPRHHPTRPPGGVEDSPDGYPQDPPYSWWKLDTTNTNEPTRPRRRETGSVVQAGDFTTLRSERLRHCSESRLATACPTSMSASSFGRLSATQCPAAISSGVTPRRMETTVHEDQRCAWS